MKVRRKLLIMTCVLGMASAVGSLWPATMAQDDASTASASGIEGATGQTAATNAGGTPGLRAVPRLVKFSGALSSQIAEMMPATPGESGNAGQSRVVTMAFSLYESQQGGASLWTETQDVQVDEQGHYTVLLGATSADGLPLDLFATAKARWLGVQPQLPGVGEQSRVALVGVPYALKAADADTLGGKPASAYVTTNVHSRAWVGAVQGEASTTLATQGLTQAPGAHTAVQFPAPAATVGGSGTTNHIPIWTNSTTLGNSALVQVGGKVGLGTATPATSLDVRSSANSLQALTSSATGTGVLGNSTATSGSTFGVQGTAASSSGVGVLGKSTSTLGSTVGVMGQVSSPNGIAALFKNENDGEILRGQSVTPTGTNQFSFDKGGNLILISGDIIFSDGSRQVKAATLDKVTAGTGLSGGGKADPTGNVTLKLDTAFTDGRYLKLSGGTLTGALAGTTATFFAGVDAKSSTGDGVSATSSSGFGVFATSDTSDGVKGQSNTGNGVAGFGGGSKAGVSGSSASGDGVEGISNTKFGVHGTSTSGFGVAGNSTSGVGVIGTAGNTATSIGVEGSAATSAAIGVAGLNEAAGTGVSGESTAGGTGVKGTSKGGGRGVFGVSDTKGGVVGMSTSGDGVAGVACSTNCGAAAVVGVGHLAGAFSGQVAVTGNVGVSGNVAIDGTLVAKVKAFHIDHPLDPANKYLNHFSVESNQLLDVYSGNVTTDRSGTATVMLPNYFSALNANYRYQLTVIGQFAQAIVFREIANNSFVIKTDKPVVKVSWQVTGVRHDAWARNRQIQVEENKPANERGYYLDPEFFGQPKEKSVFWLYNGAMMRHAKALMMEKANSEQAGAN